MSFLLDYNGDLRLCPSVPPLFMLKDKVYDLVTVRPSAICA
jgi:hypothetical protein